MIGGPAITSMIRFKANVDSYFTPSQAKVDADRARNANFLCPDYHKATTFERWSKYRNISWCKDYPDAK
jgi:hypothetical protein